MVNITYIQPGIICHRDVVTHICVSGDILITALGRKTVCCEDVIAIYIYVYIYMNIYIFHEGRIGPGIFIEGNIFEHLVSKIGQFIGGQLIKQIMLEVKVILSYRMNQINVIEMNSSSVF